jgi:hypothetical protein
MIFTCAFRLTLNIVGSGSIEGHHQRIQNAVTLEGGSTAVNHFANRLWDEETYYLEMMSNPILWSEKKQEHMKALNRHLNNKRCTLKAVTGSRTVNHHSFYLSFASSFSSTSTTTTTTSSTASSAKALGAPSSSLSQNYIDLDSDDEGGGGSSNELGFNSDSTSTDIDYTADDAEHISSPPPTASFSSLPPLPSSTIHPFFQQQLSTRRLSTSDATPATSAKTYPPPPVLPPRLDILASDRCKCDQASFNKVCSLKMCQNCCIKSMDPCGVTAHAKRKPLGYQSIRYKKSNTKVDMGVDAVNTTTLLQQEEEQHHPSQPLPGVVEHIVKAMKQGRAVHIAYANRDFDEKEARKIKPTEWLCYGEVFWALCFKSNIKKKYCTNKIRQIEDEAWVVGTPPPPAVEGILYLLVFSSPKSISTDFL